MGRNKASIEGELRELRHLARYPSLQLAGRRPSKRRVSVPDNRLCLWSNPMNARSKRAVGPATCLGGGQGDRPTWATCQLTLRILCLLLPNDSLAI